MRRYGEPRLLITLCVASNSPDWLTEASSPAYAASFLGLSNLEISPISLIIAAPVTLPMPVIVVTGESSFSMMEAISMSVSFIWHSIKEICAKSALSWNVKLSCAKVIPKECLAAFFSRPAFSLPIFCRLNLARSSARVSEGISSKSIGEGNCIRISFEVLPNISENTDWYS